MAQPTPAADSATGPAVGPASGTTSRSGRRRVLRKRVIRVVFFLAALGALFWMLHRIGWREVGESFVRVGWTGAAVLLALGFVETFLDALSLRAAIPRAPGLTGLRAFAYNATGSVVNVFIPWDAGEVVKGALFRRHVSATESISGVVLWNFLYKLTRPIVALTAALVGWIGGAAISDNAMWVVLGASLIGFVPYLVMRMLIRGGAAAAAVQLLRSVRLLRGDSTSLVDSARELDRRLRAFRRERPADFAGTFWYQIAARLTSWGTYWMCIYYMGLDYDFALVSTLVAGISVASYVAMLVPARIGVGEGAAYLVFEMFGLPGPAGLLLALVMRVKGLVVNGLGAVYGSLERVPRGPGDPGAGQSPPSGAH